MLIYEIMKESQEKFKGYTAVKWLKKKEVFGRSYEDFFKTIEIIRKNLNFQGFSKKHIALLGNNCLEWIEAFLGIITGDNAAVSLDSGLPIEDLIPLINRSDAQGIFISPKMDKYIEPILKNCPNISKIWILSEEDIAEDKKNEKVTGLYDLLEENPQAKEPNSPKGDDTALIIFTSGTTGQSKCVILTQGNLASNVEALNYKDNPGHVTLSVLPVHHAFCLVMDWLKGLSLGGCICINDSMMHMIRNMGIFKPNTMLMVPLMIETILKRLDSVESDAAKPDIAKKVLGGNLKYIFTGGAHLDPFYVNKMAEYGLIVLEGYGMSECSPVISANSPHNYKIGSVGKPLPNVEIAFDNGEILVRGSSVMKEYYKMPKETQETLKDGWLHTGDKGYLDQDGFLFINGRVKNLIILSNGENISPEEIEGKLSLYPLIKEVIITGEENGLVARIYPDPDEVLAQKLEEDDVKNKLQEILDEYNKKQPSYYRITGLVVRKNPFIKNSTRKIKRQEVLIDQPVS